uniref:BZIP domain-containing protein n=1 Tax=Ditylum brightwellii TaxID=49249 RepID=A0A6U3RW20_9STRA|mmetsp:Transcript_30169/g.44868  ORF Transcript_30169/g.44868 Transcript_30169/m.44868 type:complete len:829 (+) Transcript_30169:281-2767(+)
MRRQRQTGGTHASGNPGFEAPAAHPPPSIGNGNTMDGTPNHGGEMVGRATAAAAASSWDIEEDHLLSYFLCGNDGNHSNGLPTIDAVQEHHTTESTATTAGLWAGTSAPDLDHQPCTPAVQFYASTSRHVSHHPPQQHQQQQQQQQQQGLQLQQPIMQNVPVHSNLNKVPSRADTSSSSSSSLSSLAAALALGGGPAVMQVQQHLQARETSTHPPTSPPPSHISPISPAHVLSSHQHHHETMMLPPPPRFPNQNVTTQHGTHASQLMTQSITPPVTQSIMSTTATSQHATPMPLPQPQQQWHHPPQTTPQWQTAPTQVNFSTHQQQNPSNHVEWIRQVNSIVGSMAAQAMPLLAPAQPHAAPMMQPQHPPSIQPALPQHQQNHPPNSNMESGTTQSYAPIAPPPVSHLAINPPTQLKLQPQPQAILPNSTNLLPHPSLHPPPSMPSSITTSSFPPPNTAAPQGPGESEERRQRRLARNRESARLSRRRKKEHLANLGDRVEKLHNQIESVRRERMERMEMSLKKNRRDGIRQLLNVKKDDQTSSATTNDRAMELMNKLALILRETAPNCPVRKASIHFQYNTLKQTLLPQYYKYLLWLTTRQPDYFLAGKESRPKNTAKSSGRVSSKQIGEELTTTFKTSKETPPNKHAKSKSSSVPTGILSCRSDQASKLWPLFCYELSVSVDQEERFLLAHKRAQEKENFANDRAQIEVAATLTSNLKTGMLFQSDMATHRSETCLFQILTPTQVCGFLRWFANNRERCRNVARVLVTEKKEGVVRNKDEDVKVENCDEGLSEGWKGVDGELDGEVTLNDICRRLDEALKFQSKDS